MRLLFSALLLSFILVGCNSPIGPSTSPAPSHACVQSFSVVRYGNNGLVALLATFSTMTDAQAYAATFHDPNVHIDSGC